MENIIEFVRMFLSHCLVYVVYIACIVCAMLIGFSIRKNKNKKEGSNIQVENKESM